MEDKILKEITDVCEECPKHEYCPETECILFRIEQIINNNSSEEIQMLKLYSVTNSEGNEVLVKATDKLEAIDKARQIFIAKKIEYEKLYCEEV